MKKTIKEIVDLSWSPEDQRLCELRDKNSDSLITIIFILGAIIAIFS